MNVLLCVSTTATEAERLASNGPRRDFLELARATGGELRYRSEAPRRRGLFGRLFGPHVVQAWRAASAAQPGDTVFADGEHIGIPLALFLALRLRRGVRVVMLGHLVDRPWKRIPIAVVSRLGPIAVLVVHSVTQAERVRRGMGNRWTLEIMPYQVDTEFWKSGGELDGAEAMLLAVGSEHRDYRTLAEAVRGLPVRVRIAAGSYWSRNIATASQAPANVEYIDKPLPFDELRQAYEAAVAVVVPLEDVNNQSGVTTILEAMSMGRPVITTANRGQRECVVGPLISSSAPEVRDCRDRGPAVLGASYIQGDESGIYTLCGDVDGLRQAICTLIDDSNRRRQMGANGRATACANFRIEDFTRRLAQLLTVPSDMPMQAITAS